MPGNYPLGAVSNFPEGFANGLTLRNVPLLQAQPGAVFWLDNNGSNNPNQHAGSDSNRGSFRDPVATLTHAFAICQAGRGDIIMVAPGHSEAISSATAMQLNTSDVAVIGMGGGLRRPQFTLDTAAASTFNITGNNISFQNCQFVANFLSITSLFTPVIASFTGNVAAAAPSVLNVTAVASGTLYVGNTVQGTGAYVPPVILAQLTGTAGGVGAYQLDTTFAAAVTSASMTTLVGGFAVDNCEIRDTSATLDFLSILGSIPTTSNVMDLFSFTRNRVMLKAASGAITLGTVAGSNDRWTIADNRFASLTTNAGAVLPFSSGKVLTNLELLRNYWNVVNATGTGTGWLITTNSSGNSGFVDGNMDHALPTTPLPITLNSGFVYGLNYHSDVADLAGYLVPAADV